MKLISIIALFLASFSINAQVNSQKEIKHLLNYVASTQCKYQRNGTLHTGKEAVKHINKKYDYFKDDIKTTEDFIKYSATKSKMSGNFYYIVCPKKKPIKSQLWLQQELEHYRQAQSND